MYQIGETWKFLVRNNTWDELNIIANDNISKTSLTGKHPNRDEVYTVHFNLISEEHRIASFSEKTIHVSEVLEYWWSYEDNLIETLTSRLLSRDMEFIRFDDESLYVVYADVVSKPNRLWGTRCYEIGPIDRCPDQGRTWRKQLDPELLKRGVIPFNPLEKPIDLGIEDDESREMRRVAKLEGNYDILAEGVKIIRHVDLRLVDKADFIICYIDTSIHMCGTYEELFWANRLKMPIIVVCKQGKSGVPDWLFGTCPHSLFYDSFEDALAYLDYINNDENPEHLNRWLFLDYKKLYMQLPPLS
jgi:hypothetical protein